MATEAESLQAEIARFPVEFDLPTGRDDDLANAAEAVKSRVSQFSSMETPSVPERHSGLRAEGRSDLRS